MQKLPSNGKEAAVRRILLTPIVASKHVKGITLAKRWDDHSEFILSGQSYKGHVDEDMSDIAICFYEVVYKKRLLKSDGSLVDDQYAGDTMNSYQQIARRGKNKKEYEGCKEKWFKAYHCLANFWILPKEVGRKGGELSKIKVSKDYMDGFLRTLKIRYTEYQNKYKYFADMGEIENFYEYHGLIESGYMKDYIPTRITGLKIDKVIETMIHLRESRAEYLSEQYTDELYDLFHDKGLINEFK